MGNVDQNANAYEILRKMAFALEGGAEFQVVDGFLLANACVQLTPDEQKTMETIINATL
jgi:hypothetical protein